ncbi:hypothetical protein GF108_12275 [Phyllobacterium sp. SYP-B3895]|uniref:hypothetical protein n=1 Tax=Phyllobacterium sp. SYP-B3895 TaxID=2663240 RepID=UPI001299B271|nr:hypothetical protein [Phyllobacterium sp. SYP-B3895]MRG56356.1 hypothetical protein [Phyllobacterium sp. SYP-B3895]
MAKYFIIGETGSDDLWLVDVDERRVEPLTETTLTRSSVANADLMQFVSKARKVGIATLKGIDIAIATSGRSDIEAQMFSGDPVEPID